MKINFHRTCMFIIFYILKISYKIQYIKSLPVVCKQQKQRRQLAVDDCVQLIYAAICHFKKGESKMFFVVNDVLFIYRY